MKFLFWNLNRKPLSDELGAILQEHEPAFVALAEDPLSPANRLDALNEDVTAYFTPVSNCERVRLYTRFQTRALSNAFETSYYSIWRVRRPGWPEFLLVATHWKSPLHRRPDSQSFSLRDFAGRIREIEEKVGHNRTILIGDLNADPFDLGLVASTSFNACMSKTVALRGTRAASPHGDMPFFYNPMWSVYGDESHGPPGTYYRSSSEEVCFFWHAFDQVLVRPALVHLLPSRSVEVIDMAGELNLTGPRGTPNKSDHLPILFRMNPPEGDNHE